MVSLLHERETCHSPVVEDFLQWGDESFLQMNKKKKKTKDVFIDFREHPQVQEITFIKGQTVECVDTYKYLGTVTDSKLTLEVNCEVVYKKKKKDPAPVLPLKTVILLHGQNSADSVLLNRFYLSA